MTEDIKKMQSEIAELRKTVEGLRDGKGKPKRTREPSKFNIFVGDKIRELKAKDPKKPHKVLFSEAVTAWNNLNGKK